MARKVPDDVQNLFDRYTPSFARKLKKERALEMSQKEYDLNPEWAEVMFQMFDKDGNGILSIWEFALFYQTFGNDAKKCVEVYESSIESADSEESKADKVWQYLASLKTQKDRTFSEAELHDTIRNITGEGKHIDRQKFIEMICRVRLTRH